MATLRLDGSGWTFRACGGDRTALKARRDLARPMPAAVPGTTHGQLLALGRIPDPHQGRNELDLQWVDKLDWSWERTLAATAADCGRARQELVFEGLDTVATVFLNGREVGRSVNQFRQVACDVRGTLKPGKNRLEVRLASPIAHATAQAAANPGNVVARLPCVKDVSFTWQTGEKRLTHRPWIRKVQCHFGWDWGLCLPTQGVWLPCRLECSDAPRLADLGVSQRHVGPAGRPTRVELTVRVRLVHPAAASGALLVSCAGREVRVPVRMRRGEAVAEARLDIAKPRLWWPAGAGEQPLYEVTARWEDGGEPMSRRLGLRTVELVTDQDRTPEGGPACGMKFRVNGRDLYMKGADWIPADHFVERCTEPVYRHLLESMRDAHMNMVRVWGGGWYELDVFYDLCDELGLLVWQDFMMACALYPDTPGFIAEVEAEARHQVRRLQHRACLALWCGDNENLTGVNHWWKDKDRPEAVRRGYTNMMTRLRAVVEKEDPGRRFWVSSPSNGWIDKDSESPDSGDVHFWAVWHGQQPFSHYLTVRPRFASEFGFQSFAEPRTMRACVPAADLNPSSFGMEHHQRSGEGNQRILNTIGRELPVPDGFDAFCWMSQVNQASAITTAVEHWRRAKPWCMGTLYWQVNDLWPVASWSSIDWHGRWKALHHAAKRFNAPLLASLVHDKVRGMVEVWATSDLPRGLRLAGALEAVAMDGRVVGAARLSGALPADGSRKLAEVPVAALLRGGKVHPREVVLFVELAGDGVRAENHLALVPWKHVTLERPRLRGRITGRTGAVALELATDRVAPFVHAEVAGTESRFNGDFDVLRPGRTYRLDLVEHRHRGQRPLTPAQARRGLRLASLWDWAWRDGRGS